MVEEEILGFEVAVENVAIVQVLEREGHARRIEARLRTVEGERASTAHPGTASGTSTSQRGDRYGWTVTVSLENRFALRRCVKNSPPIEYSSTR